MDRGDWWAIVHRVTKMQTLLKQLNMHATHRMMKGYCLVTNREADGEDNGTPLQYSCLANPMEGGTWWAAVHGVAKSWT